MIELFNFNFFSDPLLFGIMVVFVAVMGFLNNSAGKKAKTVILNYFEINFYFKNAIEKGVLEKKVDALNRRNLISSMIFGFIKLFLIVFFTNAINVALVTSNTFLLISAFGFFFITVGLTIITIFNTTCAALDYQGSALPFALGAIHLEDALYLSCDLYV